MAALPPYVRFVMKHPGSRFRFWTWSHRLTAAGFFAILVLGQNEWFPWLKGSPTAARWFQAIPFVDPLAALEVVLASRSLPLAMLPAVCLTLLVAALLGRVFCGWLCPLGLITELNGAVAVRLRRWLLLAHIRPPVIRIPRQTKYWLLTLFLGLSLVSGVPIFTAVSPVNMTVLAVLSAPIVPLAIIGAILVFEHFSPRAFCRGLCPLGALYSLVGRFGLLRVSVRSEAKQTLCHQCTRQCPMGIRVMQDHVLAGHATVTDPECTRCGTCTGGVLQLRLGRRSSSPGRS